MPSTIGCNDWLLKASFIDPQETLMRISASILFVQEMSVESSSIVAVIYKWFDDVMASGCVLNLLWNFIKTLGSTSSNRQSNKTVIICQGQGVTPCVLHSSDPVCDCLTSYAVDDRLTVQACLCSFGVSWHWTCLCPADQVSRCCAEVGKRI